MPEFIQVIQVIVYKIFFWFQQDYLTLIILVHD